MVDEIVLSSLEGQAISQGKSSRFPSIFASWDENLESNQLFILLINSNCLLLFILFLPAFLYKKDFWKNLSQQLQNQ